MPWTPPSDSYVQTALDGLTNVSYVGQFGYTEQPDKYLVLQRWYGRSRLLPYDSAYPGTDTFTRTDMGGGVFTAMQDEAAHRRDIWVTQELPEAGGGIDDGGGFGGGGGGIGGGGGGIGFLGPPIGIGPPIFIFPPQPPIIPPSGVIPPVPIPTPIEQTQEEGPPWQRYKKREPGVNVFVALMFLGSLLALLLLLATGEREER